MKSKFIIAVLFSVFTFHLTAQNTKSISAIAPALSVKRLGNDVNSLAADYAPACYGDRIYFTSIQASATPDAKPVSRIMSFIPGEKAAVETELNLKRNGMHIAHTALLPDASRVWFTLCRDEEQDKCEIWSRERQHDGSWGVAQKLPDHINLRGSTATQPAVGYDLSLKKYVLYFASDRSGGKGDKDIWSSTMNWEGTYEQPVCMPFNTAKDEVTPYYDPNAFTLFFSSNGMKGQGRFDIYRVEKTTSAVGWTAPVNMGKPFNTGYDDLYFTFHKASQTAFLASDRPGSVCGSGTEGFHCLDIYEVRFPAKEPSGKEVGMANK